MQLYGMGQAGHRPDRFALAYKVKAPALTGFSSLKGQG